MQDTDLNAIRRRALLLECQYAASLFVIRVLKALFEMENTEIHDPTTGDCFGDETIPYPFTHYFHTDGRVVPLYEERLKHADNPDGKLTAPQQAFIQGFNEYLDDLIKQAEQAGDTDTLDVIGDVAAFRQQALSQSVWATQPLNIQEHKARSFAREVIRPDWERAMMEWNNYVIEHKLDADAVKHLQDTVRARQRRKKRR